MEKNDYIINLINVQKNYFNEWINSLIFELSKDQYKKQNLYLVEEKWINKYQKNILNSKDKEKLKNYEELKDISNNELFDLLSEKKKKIDDYPKVFVLDKDTWKVLQKEKEPKIKPTPSVATFYKKLLLLNLKNSNYCFFFIDNKDQLRQGYLKINNSNLEEMLKNEFQNKGINNFKFKGKWKIFKKGKKEITDSSDLYYKEENKFEIKIFKHNKKDIDTKEGFCIVKDEKEILRRNYSIFIPYSKVSEIQKNNKNIKAFDIEETFRNSMTLRKRMCSIYTVGISIDDFNKISNNKINENKEKKEEENLNNLKDIEKNDPNNQISSSSEKKNISNNLEEKQDKTKDIKKLSSPGIKGLSNIGATCYMNATLQCFSNIGRLREKLLNKDVYKNLENNKDKNNKLSFALAEVIKNLWEKLDQEVYSPEHFKQVISEMNPLFKGIAANDPKDLILFLLDKIHKELNTPQYSIQNQFKNFVPDNRNFIDVYNDFIYFFISKNKSIISDEFYGYINSMTCCGYCQTTIHNVQIINILFLPLEEVRKFMGYNTNSVSILDCFEYYEKTEILPSYYCTYCQQSYQAYNQNKILYAPRTLILNLNRGIGLQFKINILFDELLDLRKYIFAGDSPYYYELTGVICHFGTNDDGGHFIAYCKNYKDCQWYKYNDGMVNKCTFNDVKVNGLTYVLFYSFINA